MSGLMYGLLGSPKTYFIPAALGVPLMIVYNTAVAELLCRAAVLVNIQPNSASYVILRELIGAWHCTSVILEASIVMRQYGMYAYLLTLMLVNTINGLLFADVFVNPLMAFDALLAQHQRPFLVLWEQIKSLFRGVVPTFFAIVAAEFLGSYIAYFSTQYLWRLNLTSVHNYHGEPVLQTKTPLRLTGIAGAMCGEFLLTFIYVMISKLPNVNQEGIRPVWRSFMSTNLVYFGMLPTGAFFNSAMAFGLMYRAENKLKPQEWAAIYVVAPLLAVVLAHYVWYYVGGEYQQQKKLQEFSEDAEITARANAAAR